MLQECHILESELKLWKQDWGLGNIYCNPLNSRSCGQVILLKDKRDIVEHKIILEGRIHILKIRIAGVVFSLINVYGPNKEIDRRHFLEKLQNVLISYDFGDYLIIGGDFNIVQDNIKDKNSKNTPKNIKNEQTWCQRKIKEIKDSYSLVDIWRQKNSAAKRYTWSQTKPLVRCRLDYFLISKRLSNLSMIPKILPAIKTDHALIEITIKLSGPPRGPGIWKLNTSILQDQKYKTEIKTLIDTAWNELAENDNLALRFDWVKYKIRQFSITYSKTKAKINREQELKIVKEIEDLDEKICNETINEQELLVYEELKKQFEKIEE